MVHHIPALYTRAREMMLYKKGSETIPNGSTPRFTRSDIGAEAPRTLALHTQYGYGAGEDIVHAFLSRES